MRARHLLLPALAVGAASFLAAPETAEGFVIFGFELPLDQRDVRIYNNFLDNAANNNGAQHANWPGYDGAELAIWKGCTEWGSEIFGSGAGDPSQPNGIGSGGANFDPSWQGNANGIGSMNGNVHSALDANGGGVLAFAEAPSSNGWRIRYYENHTWNDGPGTSFFGVDLQGVAAHEYGHAVGLGHSGTFQATMFGSINGSGVPDRSIHPDDVNGVQAAYGVKAGNKPRIDSATTDSGMVTLTGVNFSPSDNEVWFTREGNSQAGFPVKVTGVVSSGGGTSISVLAPPEAGPGAVLVRNDGNSGSNLSNAFPVDPDSGGPPPPPGAPSIASLSPGTVDQVVVDGPQVVTIQGTDFSSVDSVVVDGEPLAVFPAEFNVLNDSTITFDMPLTSSLGAIDVEVSGPQGSDSAQITVQANDPPVIELVSSDPGFLTSPIGLQLAHGAEPGELYVSFLSTDQIPSSLPGLFDLAIGNGLSSLFLLASPTIGAAGLHELTVPFSGIAPGTALHVQGAVLELGGSLPLTATNVQSGTVLF